MIRLCGSSLATVFVARITETIFETPNNQGKNNQPRIAAVGVYFTTYSICDDDSSFQIKIKGAVIWRQNSIIAVLVNYIFNVIYSQKCQSKYDIHSPKLPKIFVSDNIPPKECTLMTATGLEPTTT